MKEFPNIFPICQKVIKFFQNINLFIFIIAQLAGGVFWPRDNATGAAAVDLMRRRTISRLSGDHVNQSRMRERGIRCLGRESKRSMSTEGGGRRLSQPSKPSQPSTSQERRIQGMECLWRGEGSKNKLMEVECFAYCADEVFLYELLRAYLGPPCQTVKRYRN